MLRHIIMFKLAESDNKSEKVKNAEIVKKQIESLKQQIPEIVNLEVGINIIELPWSYDIVLTVDFKNLKDLETYKNHPAHLKLIEFNKLYSVAKSSVDYII